jgi:hypothetical protein
MDNIFVFDGDTSVDPLRMVDNEYPSWELRYGYIGSGRGPSPVQC